MHNNIHRMQNMYAKSAVEIFMLMKYKLATRQH